MLPVGELLVDCKLVADEEFCIVPPLGSTYFDNELSHDYHSFNCHEPDAIRLT